MQVVVIAKIMSDVILLYTIDGGVYSLLDTLLSVVTFNINTTYTKRRNTNHIRYDTATIITNKLYR